ncbi:hypothetical protein CTheo_8060 [Ceratobasidium theobromae]|uniref:Uncharacterized protein n=1 Tax=Ceratobasidium theobromae TaxID=1582974 RepID=A0A5N5QAR6_9AGAM|nr:hypothetical protein CTheo_8060 [Ceratobasidium theobromae]
MAHRTQQLGTRRADKITQNTVTSKKPHLDLVKIGKTAGKSQAKKAVASRGRGWGKAGSKPTARDGSDYYDKLGVKCCLCDGMVEHEEGFTFKDEEENRHMSAEMYVYLRAMNRWAFVNEDGELVVPKQVDLQDSRVFLLGWTAALSGGQRCVQHIMTGYWPPKENNEGLGQVWQMHSAVLKVRVKDIFFEDVKNKVMDFHGVWVSSEDAHYLLQSPLTEYAHNWAKASCFLGFERFKWQDIPPEGPLPDWIKGWTRSMVRMEYGLPITHLEDSPYWRDETDSLLSVSDAESISKDDENPLPTSTKWWGGDPYGESPTWSDTESRRIEDDHGNCPTNPAGEDGTQPKGPLIAHSPPLPEGDSSGLSAIPHEVPTPLGTTMDPAPATTTISAPNVGESVAGPIDVPLPSTSGVSKPPSRNPRAILKL